MAFDICGKLQEGPDTDTAGLTFQTPSKPRPWHSGLLVGAYFQFCVGMYKDTAFEH